MSRSLSRQIVHYVEMKQKLGYNFESQAVDLRSFARFAHNRGESFIVVETVLAWAVSAVASRPRHAARLRVVHAFASWLHAADPRHEVPPRDALGSTSSHRPPPRLLSVEEIRRLLNAALDMRPRNTIAPLTWHYLFGLIAATGMRIGEALGLTLNDITPDGLIIRNAKFGKTRMIVLHPSVEDALHQYLAVRHKENTDDDHLFVIATGRPPGKKHTGVIFRKLAVQAGLRQPNGSLGPTIHSLRHSFAVRTLENMRPDADPGRHMLTLATYLGHSNVSNTYWYLESTPILLQQIADATEHAHVTCAREGDHD